MRSYEGMQIYEVEHKGTQATAELMAGACNGSQYVVEIVQLIIHLFFLLAPFPLFSNKHSLFSQYHFHLLHVHVCSALQEHRKAKRLSGGTCYKSSLTNEQRSLSVTGMVLHTGIFDWGSQTRYDRHSY